MSDKTAWTARAEKELRGRPLQDLTWNTAEGIAVSPVYTADDAKDLDHMGSMPGEAPFTRGPRSTMYTGRPWTIRQYAGFSTAEESNAFYRQALAGGQQGVWWPSIWPRTAAMTVTTTASSVMWARPASPSTALRI